MELKLVDISTFNRGIDYAKLKKSVDGVIIRCGYGSDIASQDDEMWNTHVSNCEKYGIPYGVYLYSYALNRSNAQSETAHILRLIKGKKLSYPVYIDLEDSSQRPVFNADWFVEMGKAIEAEGYMFGVYANLDWFRNVIGNRLDQFTKWCAAYGVNNGKPNTKPNIGEDIWQYSSVGVVDGISKVCDVNICYRDFPTEINGGATTPETPVETTPDGTTLELVTKTMNNEYGTGEERKKALGTRWNEVMEIINHIAEASVETLANEVIADKYGKDDVRKTVLGTRFEEVQKKVNEIYGVNTSTIYYTVESGDTLTSISEMFETTVDKLISLNAIKNPNLIYAGDRLRIK